MCPSWPLALQTILGRWREVRFLPSVHLDSVTRFEQCIFFFLTPEDYPLGVEKQKTRLQNTAEVCQFHDIWNCHKECDGILCNVPGNICGVPRKPDGVPGRLARGRQPFPPSWGRDPTRSLVELDISRVRNVVDAEHGQAEVPSWASQGRFSQGSAESV